MKKLLIFTLIIGLFTGCKKSEEAPETCYIGEWGNEQNLCSDKPAKIIPHTWRLSIKADGTGIFKTYDTCNLTDYNYIFTFNYVQQGNDLIISNASMKRNNIFVSSNEGSLEYTMYNLAKITFKCIDANHFQILGDGLGNNVGVGGSGYYGSKNTYVRL